VRKTTLALLATLAIAAPIGVAQAAGVAVTIATPFFGLQLGAPIYAPPIYAPPVYVAPVYAPPVVLPAPVYAPPRYVAVPRPVYPVAYPYAVLPARPKHHKHAGHPHHRPVPVVAVPYRRY